MVSLATIILNPWARTAGAVVGVLGIWWAFASHYEGKGAAEAVAKIEKATTNAVKKAERAGKRSNDGGGVLNPNYRD